MRMINLMYDFLGRLKKSIVMGAGIGHLVIIIDVLKIENVGYVVWFELYIAITLHNRVIVGRDNETI